MPVRLSQGPVSWTVQKYSADVQHDGVSQAVPRAKIAQGGVCLKSRNLCKKATKVVSKTRGACIQAAVGNLSHEKDLLFRLSLNKINTTLSRYWFDLRLDDEDFVQCRIVSSAILGKYFTSMWM